MFVRFVKSVNALTLICFSALAVSRFDSPCLPEIYLPCKTKVELDISVVRNDPSVMLQVIRSVIGRQFFYIKRFCAVFGNNFNDPASLSDR